MNSITFDTLKYVERLKAAGVSDAQAKAEVEALVDVLAESTSNTLSTKADMSRLDLRLTTELAPVKIELAVLKWMVGFNLALTVAILWKIFS